MFTETHIKQDPTLVREHRYNNHGKHPYILFVV